MASVKALVKPELLSWARIRAKVTIEDAAKAASVKADEIARWEIGDDAPTLNQLRNLARKYHFPLAVFYLPSPPTDFAPLRDFRRLPDAPQGALSANLAFHVRTAYERREVALELYDELGERPHQFPIRAKVTDNPETVAAKIRSFLEIDAEKQKEAASKHRSFDFLRRRLEEHDILVFVVGGPHYIVPLNEMRGFALAKPDLPVIVVNGRDPSQGGKCFTLLHELAHIALGESAISNGTGDDFKSSAEEQQIERFCDAVSAAVLMPVDLMLSFPSIRPAGQREWGDEELRRIANEIGVSREALLLRFISMKRASWAFYNSRRARFKDEYRRAEEERLLAPKTPIPIKRPILLMSWNGRNYTRLVLRSYYDQRITLNDVSSYLGAKVKHIPALERAAFQPVD